MSYCHQILIPLNVLLVKIALAEIQSRITHKERNKVSDQNIFRISYLSRVKVSISSPIEPLFSFKKCSSFSLQGIG